MIKGWKTKTDPAASRENGSCSLASAIALSNRDGRSHRAHTPCAHRESQSPMGLCASTARVNRRLALEHRQQYLMAKVYVTAMHRVSAWCRFEDTV